MDYSLKGCKESDRTKQAVSTGHSQGRGRGGVELLLTGLLYFYILLLSPRAPACNTNKTSFSIVLCWFLFFCCCCCLSVFKFSFKC